MVTKVGTVFALSALSNRPTSRKRPRRAPKTLILKACCYLLEKDTLRKALAKAKAESVQASSGHPGWDSMRGIFPEVFDGIVRGELADLGSLPLWASEPSPEALQSEARALV